MELRHCSAIRNNSDANGRRPTVAWVIYFSNLVMESQLITSPRRWGRALTYVPLAQTKPAQPGPRKGLKSPTYEHHVASWSTKHFTHIWDAVMHNLAHPDHLCPNQVRYIRRPYVVSFLRYCEIANFAYHMHICCLHVDDPNGISPRCLLWTN